MISASTAALESHNIAKKLYSEFLEEQIKRAVAKGELRTYISTPWNSPTVHVSHWPPGCIAVWSSLNEVLSFLAEAGYQTEVRSSKSGLNTLQISW